MRKGFTLIEFLVVIAIICILCGLGSVMFQGCANGAGFSSSYGREIQRTSIDRTTFPYRYRFQDVNTGERFWSYDEQGEGI